MAITNLQQARQMFRYGGDTMGGPNDKSNNNNNNNNNGNGRPETTRHNPHTDSGTSKTSTVTGDEMRSAERDFIQTVNTNNAIRAAQTGTKFDAFNNFTPTFASKQKKGLGIMDLVLMGASGGLLGAKAKTLGGLFSKGKFALDKSKQIGGLLETIGLTDKNVVDSFTSNFSDKFSGFGKGKKSTSTTKNTLTDNRGEREGLASIENQAAGYDEYILLLQKLQSGNISDSERNRFNVLKNMLGI